MCKVFTSQDTVDAIALYIADNGDWEASGILHDAILDNGTHEDDQILTSIISENHVERIRTILKMVPPREILPGMKMRLIPPGKFLMGSPEGDVQAYPDEFPQHEIEIKDSFWLGETNVTEAQWKQVMGFCPSSHGDDFPVVNISWNEAQEFCKKLSTITGKKCRLPTEEEWEYACRSGTTTRYWNGDNVSDLLKTGWFNGNSNYHIHPVAKLLPNNFGLYDMHGNVWEWCQDKYQPYQEKLNRRTTNVNPFQVRGFFAAGAGSTTAGTAGQRTATGSSPTTGTIASASDSSLEDEQSSDPTKNACCAVDLLPADQGSAASPSTPSTRLRTPTTTWGSELCSSNYKIFKGGSFCDRKKYCYSVTRLRGVSSYCYVELGFRIAIEKNEFYL